MKMSPLYFFANSQRFQYYKKNKTTLSHFFGTDYVQWKKEGLPPYSSSSRSGKFWLSSSECS